MRIWTQWAWGVGWLFMLAAAPCSWSAVVLDIGEAEGPSGATVHVPVSLAPGTETVAVLVLRIQLDLDALALLDVTPGAAALGAGKSVSHHVQTGGLLTVVVYGGAAIAGAGEVFSLSFSILGPPSRVIPLSAVNADAASPSAAFIEVDVIPGQITVDFGDAPHSADTDGNGRLSMAELLAVVALFEAGEYHCASGGGYAAGVGDRTCPAHDSDYAPQDWRIGLEEMLRLVQLYNADEGRYRRDAAGEDGFGVGDAR